MTVVLEIEGGWCGAVGVLEVRSVVVVIELGGYF